MGITQTQKTPFKEGVDLPFKGLTWTVPLLEAGQIQDVEDDIVALFEIGQQVPNEPLAQAKAGVIALPHLVRVCSIALGSNYEGIDEKLLRTVVTFRDVQALWPIFNAGLLGVKPDTGKVIPIKQPGESEATAEEKPDAAGVA